MTERLLIMHHPLESWIVVYMCRDRYIGNTDCDNRRNAPIRKQDFVLRGSACPIPDVWTPRRTHGLPSLLPSYFPQPRLLRRIAWVDFGGVYYGTCITVGVWCSAPRRQARATRSSVSLPLPEGNAGGGAANRGETSAESAWPMDAHTRIRDLTSKI